MGFDRLINKVFCEAVDPSAQLVILQQVVENQVVVSCRIR